MIEIKTNFDNGKYFVVQTMLYDLSQIHYVGFPNHRLAEIILKTNCPIVNMASSVGCCVGMWKPKKKMGLPIYNKVGKSHVVMGNPKNEMIIKQQYDFDIRLAEKLERAGIKLPNQKQ